MIGSLYTKFANKMRAEAKKSSWEKPVFDICGKWKFGLSYDTREHINSVGGMESALLALNTISMNADSSRFPTEPPDCGY